MELGAIKLSSSALRIQGFGYCELIRLNVSFANYFLSNRCQAKSENGNEESMPKSRICSEWSWWNMESISPSVLIQDAIR